MGKRKRNSDSGAGDVGAKQSAQPSSGDLTDFGAFGSSESVKSELSMFDGHSYQVTHLKAQWLPILPKNQYTGTNGTDIIFKIRKSPGWYLSLRDSYITVQVSIEKADGTAVDAELVGFENFALGTLFKDVSFLSSNQTKLEGESQQYAYRAYLYALLNGSYSAKKFQLQVAGWMKDAPGKVDGDSTNDDDVAKPKTTGNEGFIARREWTKGGGKLELCGPVFLDTWMQRQYFIDDQDYQLTFKLNEPKFALHANKNDVAYKINMEKCACI